MMKMHPKPMVRHAQVRKCAALVVTERGNAELPVHLVLHIDGRTQRVCMTPGEALIIASALRGAADDAS